MTGDELVRRDAVDSWVEVLGPVGDLAGKIARTSFVPRDLQGNPAAVAAAILTGREMNLGPMASLRGIHIVEGRPSLTAEMLAARILAAGHRIEWKESTDKTARVRIERADGQSEADGVWTIADAQRAGLANKQVWQKYPRAMLRHRALTEAASMACPDVALGLDVAPGMDTPGPVRGTSTVVQLAPPAPEPTPTEPQTEPEPAETVPETIEIVTETGIETAEILSETETEPLITPPQMRKMSALIRELEAQTGERLNRDARRHLITDLASLDQLDSANNLTKDQASTVIDRLEALTTPTPT